MSEENHYNMYHNDSFMKVNGLILWERERTGTQISFPHISSTAHPTYFARLRHWFRISRVLGIGSNFARGASLKPKLARNECASGRVCQSIGSGGGEFR